MEFKKCYTAGRVFGNLKEDEKEQVGMSKSSCDEIEQMFKKKDPKADQVYQMYRLLSVCHTVVVDKHPETGKISYLASSPDELALIQGAEQIGLVLKKKTATTMTIEDRTQGEPFNDVYEVKAEFPFDSTRKRISLIVRNKKDNDYILMTKGADSIMLPRIQFTETKADQRNKVQIEKALLDFALDGLRTLVVG